MAVCFIHHLAPVQTAQLPGGCFKLRDDVDGGLRRAESESEGTASGSLIGGAIAYGVRVCWAKKER